MKINNFENNVYIPKHQAAEPNVKQQEPVTQRQTQQTTGNEDPPAVAVDSTVTVPAGSHMVQAKETLYSIANHYGTTVAKIIELNPELKTDKNGNKIIQLGSIIKVSDNIQPEKIFDKPEPNQPVYGSWQIEEGKGAYSVMSKFNLFKEELAKLNPDINLNNIKKDQTLKVPGYQVKSGDTLYAIAKSHDITVDMLKELNPKLGEVLKPGDILNVPKLAGQDLGFENLEVEFDVIEEKPEKITHTIKNGEALSLISEKYHIPMWALMLHNNIEDEDKIYKNQVLEIPTEDEISQLEALKNKPQEPTEKEEAPKTHTIKRGDTLSEIALKYGVTVKELKEWNNLKNDIIDAGQVLRLTKPEAKPADKPTSNQPKVTKYTVKSGDVLSIIAEKYGVSSAAIMFKNNIQNPKRIQPNQVLIIPDKNEVEKLEAEARKIKAQQSAPTPQKKKISSSKTQAAAGTIPANRGIVIHKVKKGDTLQSVAAKYGIPLKDLITYNQGLKGIKSTASLAEKEIKHLQIIATKKAVIDATGVSEEFINNLISIEKKRNRLYNDACGIPTIGIGHNTRAHGDTGLYRGKTISDNQVYSLLARDITEAQTKIRDAIGKDAYDNLSRGQKEALYGLIFNTGGLSDSPKLIAALKKGDYEEAACQMNHATGVVNGRRQVLPGLAKRRFMDIAQFVEGSRLSRSETRTVMQTVQRMYDNGFNSIRNQNTKVDYNAFAKKFLGEYIDKGWIALKE